MKKKKIKEKLHFIHNFLFDKKSAAQSDKYE